MIIYNIITLYNDLYNDYNVSEPLRISEVIAKEGVL